jgi:hypothetical protein
VFITAHDALFTRRDQVDVVRNPYGLGCADCDELGVATTFHQQHDPVAHCKRVHSGAEFGNDARGFKAEDLAGTGRWRVEALPLEEVGAIDPGAGDPNDDLAIADDRVRDFRDVQLLGSARCCNDDCAQRSGALVSQSGGQESWPESDDTPTAPVHTGPSPAVLENDANGSCQSPSPSSY